MSIQRLCTHSRLEWERAAAPADVCSNYWSFLVTVRPSVRPSDASPLRKTGHFRRLRKSRPSIVRLNRFHRLSSRPSNAPIPIPESPTGVLRRVIPAEVVLIMRSNFRRTEQRRKSGGGENRSESPRANDNEVEIPARNHVFIFHGNYSEGKNKERRRERERERFAVGDQFPQHGTEASSTRARAGRAASTPKTTMTTMMMIMVILFERRWW